MNSVPETSEVGRDWVRILREQGRSMAWLATQTGTTYPKVVAYRKGITPAPPEWLDRVYELLGERPS